MPNVEIILKEQVEHLGAEGDIVKVKAGYARNFLFPSGVAAPATAASKKQIENLMKKRAAREAAELNEADELSRRLNKQKLSFTLTAGEGSEKVFGSVTANDVAEKLKELGFNIDRKSIDLPRAIKDGGDHEVSIKLKAGVVASVSVKVEVPKKEVVVEEDEFPRRKSSYKAKKAAAATTEAEPSKEA
jgi:large subunit ribosomal protein L9